MKKTNAKLSAISLDVPVWIAPTGRPSNAQRIGRHAPASLTRELDANGVLVVGHRSGSACAVPNEPNRRPSFLAISSVDLAHRKRSAENSMISAVMSAPSRGLAFRTKRRRISQIQLSTSRRDGPMLCACTPLASTPSSCGGRRSTCRKMRSESCPLQSRSPRSRGHK